MTNAISGSSYVLYKINDMIIERHELLSPPTQQQLADSIDLQKIEELLKTGQAAGVAIKRAALLDNKEKRLLETLFPAGSLSASTVDLFDLFGLKIFTYLQDFVDTKNSVYRDFFNLYSRTEMDLNIEIETALISQEEQSKILEMSRFKRSSQEDRELVIKNWKSWEKRLEDAAHIKIDTTLEKQLKIDLQEKLEKLKDYINCLKKMLRHEDKKRCFFSIPCSLSLISDNPQREIIDLKSDLKFFKEYVNFVFTWQKFSISEVIGLNPNGPEKKEPLDIEDKKIFTELLEAEKNIKDQIKEKLKNPQTLKNCLSCLSLIHKECKKLNEKKVLLNKLLADCYDPEVKAIKQKNRAKFYCSVYIRSLVCIHSFLSMFIQDKFPECYPNHNGEEATLVRRLSYNLMKLLDMLDELDASSLKFQELKGTILDSQKKDSLSEEERGFVGGISNLFDAYFSPLTKELNKSWRDDWHDIMSATIGHEETFIPLENRPTSFIQDKLREPVQRFQDYTASHFPRFKEEIFAFFIDEVLPKLPPEKREINYLRELMNHVPLAYYSYVLSMTDGAQILEESSSLEKKSIFFENFASLFYLEDIKKFIDMKRKSELIQSGLLEDSSREIEENQEDLTLKQDPISLEEEISEELKIIDLRETIETESFIQTAQEKKLSKIQRNKKTQKPELIENALSQKETEEQRELIEMERVEEFFKDLKTTTISGRALLKFLTNRLGFNLKSNGRTTGSHRALFNKDLKVAVTVPAHHELSIGVVKTVRDQVLHGIELKQKSSK